MYYIDYVVRQYIEKSLPRFKDKCHQVCSRVSVYIKIDKNTPDIFQHYIICYLIVKIYYTPSLKHSCTSSD